MKYSIKVNEVRAKEGSNIKGFATVVFGDSFLHDLNHFCIVMSHLEAGYELILINTFFTSYL